MQNMVVNDPEKMPIEKANVIIPGQEIPTFRTKIATERGTLNNIMMKTWGGLGDQICAEPTLRYASTIFKGCKISLASPVPELFAHLKFAEVYNLNECEPIWDKYFTFNTIVAPNRLTWEFFSHGLVNCVDFPSLCALRMQLPVKDREIFITGKKPRIWNDIKDLKNPIVIHAGKHWKSKTFPKDWWDTVIELLVDRDATPILIGADTDDNRSTVDVDPSECVDLRNELSLQESVYFLQRAKVLLTNDSSPLHMAASTDPNEPFSTGHCWVGYIATCKHPDYITHFRKRQWQYREVNFGRGGMWELTDYCPNKTETVEFGDIDEATLRSWLPHPVTYAEWAVEKSKS